MKVIVGTIIKKDDKYLLVQEKQEHCYGKWNLPAGHLDEGESIFDGAIRETKEETGFDVALDNLITVNQLANQTGIAIIFGATIKSGEMKIDPKEILDVKWFTHDELKNLDLRASFIIECIEKVENGVSYPIEIVKSVSERNENEY